MRLLWICAILTVLSETRAEIFDCPLGWETYDRYCYHFVIYPPLSFDDALAACQINGALLLSVQSIKEHNFIVSWLKRHSSLRFQWYTGGIADRQGYFIWSGDGKRILNEQHLWLDGTERNRTGSIIVYKLKGTQIGWSRTTRSAKHSYICEINQADAYKIVQQKRGFDYGTDIVDPNNLKRGPNMTIEAKSSVVFGNDNLPYLECVATGNPQPKYKWYKGEQSNVEINSNTDSRYTVTNGRLSFSHPNEDKDAGWYQCYAENKFGKILGNPAQLSFGSLGEFSNVPPDAVYAVAYQSAVIICSTIRFKPAVRYQWIKGSAQNFVRTEKQKYIFISTNGRLYFSEVSRNDQGTYQCLVTLTSGTENYLETTQPPSRTSLPIPLIVQTSPAQNDWGPLIHNDFIHVYPTPPSQGQRVQLECFAQGSSPLTYFWTREDSQMSDRVSFADNNRVVIIDNAQFEDEGLYKCIVSRGQKARAEKMYSLKLASRPYFIFSLRNQHVDVNSQLTWRCEARGSPPAVYSWYKNGVLLKSVPGDMEINNNILIIRKLDGVKHNGMYQCAATNSHGKVFSGAQLRVLAFKPTFIHSPLPKMMRASYEGNVTIICNPQAAPIPVIKWSHNGRSLSLQDRDTTSRIRKLANGNLFIHSLSKQDKGKYTCTATNDFGSASASTQLLLSDTLVITQKSTNERILINETAFFYCSVSYNHKFDVVHIWSFNGWRIDTDHSPHYALDTEKSPGGLYIKNANFMHAGYYNCTVKSTVDQVSTGAYLTVMGPPGEPLGIFVDDNSIGARTMRLRWTPGSHHGSPVAYYIVEASTNFDKTWKIITDRIPDKTTIFEDKLFRAVDLDGLNPNTNYKFRLKAVNKFGVGDASLPSVSYRTKPAPPSKALDYVGGGGGKVGMLNLSWTPLNEGDHAGPGIGYIVYYRLKGESEDKWRKQRLFGVIGELAVTVATTYTMYEVKVQAFNNYGNGPNSTIQNVYSAEGMPIGTPTNVFADTLNATAIVVTWTPVPNTLAAMKGEVLGYQVNYWNRDVIDARHQFISFRGQLDTGDIVGLLPNGYYYVNIQVFNSAGLGPVSETYVGSTGMEAPLHYPTEVAVHSHSSSSVLATFRGITTGLDEDPPQGYKLFYWPATQEFKTAPFVKLGLTDHGIITGIEYKILYKLRVLAYSGSGDGKKSSTVYFTLGGQVSFDPSISKILAASNEIHTSYVTMSILLLLSLTLTIT